MTRDRGISETARWILKRLSRSDAPRTPGVDTIPRSDVRAVPIHSEEIYIFAGVPFDDIGGGQRSAQLARVFANSGFQVTYIYVYKRYDFELQRVVESEVTFPRIRHLMLKDITADTVFEGVTPGSVAIFELPHRKFLPFLRRAKSKGVTTIFELIDAWDTSLGRKWFSDEVYGEFVKVADRVVGTARPLVDDLIARGRPDAEYLPNAVNDSIFDPSREVRPAQ